MWMEMREILGHHTVRYFEIGNLFDFWPRQLTEVGTENKSDKNRRSTENNLFQ